MAVMVSPIYGLTDMLIPELYQLKDQVVRSFNMGNNIRVYSELEPEETNELLDYANEIQAEIDSRQITQEIEV